MKNIIPKSKFHFLLLKMLLVLTLMLSFFGCNTFAADLSYLDLPETVTCEYQGYEPEHKEEMYIGKRSISRIIKNTYVRLLFTENNKTEHVLLISMHKYPYSKSLWLDPSKNNESVFDHKPVKVIFNPPGERGIKNISALLPPESWQGYPSTIVLYNNKTEERIYVAYRKGPGTDDISWSIADATDLHKNLPKIDKSWKPAYSPTSIEEKCAPHSYYNSVAFSPDGKYALSGSSDRAVKLWDIKSGKKIRVFNGHIDNVRSVAFSPDGRNIISGSWDNTVKLWDVNSGLLIRTFTGHTGHVYSVAFSPDGKRILSGSWDTTMRLWDIESGTELRTFKKKSNSCYHGGCAGPIHSVVISMNGYYALSASSDQEINLWEIESGKNIRTFQGHTDMYINTVAFSPNGKYALSGSNDQTAKIWEVSSGWEIGSLEQNAGYIYSVAFSPDGRYVLSGNENGLLLLWELASSKLIRTFKGHSGIVRSVAFSPDGRLILSGSEDETLKLWDVESGKRIRTFMAEPEEVPSKCKKDSSINTSNTSLKQQAETKYEKEKVIKRKNQKLSLEMPSFDCYKESYNNMKSMDANCFSSLIDKIILYLSKDCRYQFSASRSFLQITPSEDCQQEFKVALQEKIPQIQECYQAPANAKCKEQMNNFFVRGALGPDNCTKAMERLVKICGDDLSADENCYKENWSGFETACNQATIQDDKYDTVITKKISKKDTLNAQNNKNNSVLKDKNNQLIEAIKKDSLSDVQNSLAEGADVNAKVDWWGTPLQCAAAQGKTEIAKLLIEKGADVNAKDSIRQDTALHVAVIMNKTEVAKLLIRKGADVNTIDYLKHTPLHDAAMRGNVDLVKLLIENGANMKVFINAGTPLHDAASANSIEVSKILIEKGVNVDIRDITNNTPLHYAVGAGKIEVAKFLIEKGADVNARGVFQYTPLHRAAEWNKIEMAKLLIKNGADVTLKGGIGEQLTPLMLAEKKKFFELAEILRKAGSSVR